MAPLPGLRVLNRKGVLALVLLLAACGGSSPLLLNRVPVGIWGGDDAGLIVTETGAHVHIGCTNGDVNGSMPVDAEGRFQVVGTYNVNAYPVDRGILHPARFNGATDGQTLTLTVTLTDTGEVLGPVALTYGVQPRMQICPICRR